MFSKITTKSLRNALIKSSKPSFLAHKLPTKELKNNSLNDAMNVLNLFISKQENQIKKLQDVLRENEFKKN